MERMRRRGVGVRRVFRPRHRLYVGRKEEGGEGRGSNAPLPSLLLSLPLPRGSYGAISKWLPARSDDITGNIIATDRNCYRTRRVWVLEKSSWVDLHRTSWGGNAQILSRSPISTPTALLQRGIAKKEKRGSREETERRQQHGSLPRIECPKYLPQ